MYSLIGRYANKVDLIYGDCIYESTDFGWAQNAYALLKPNGIFMVQTDYHTAAEYKIYLDKLFGKAGFVNWLIYKQEWGGISRRYFPRKHDDIIVYAKGLNYKFYPERVMIPKVTAGTSLDKRGDGLKIPCDVFDDLGNFHTTSKERVKLDEHNIQWQKPLKLMERLILPFTDEQDLVLDPFLGSGTTGVWCARNRRRFIGIENDPVVLEIAEKRIMDELGITPDMLVPSTEDV
jgi:DNA modification methylase